MILIDTYRGSSALASQFQVKALGYFEPEVCISQVLSLYLHL